MELVVNAPFPAGAMVWQPSPNTWRITLYAKATYALVHGCESDLSLHQVPVGPHDHVPLKRSADILVLGHARAAPGSSVCGALARLRIGELELTTRVESADGELPEMGPRADGWPERPQGDAAACGWAMKFAPGALRIEGPPPEGFDFALFNLARLAQQVASLPLQSAIVLEHLHPTDLFLATRLRPVGPRAQRVHPETGETQELSLQPDTLWLDADRGQASVVWRGHLDIGATDEVGKLLVSMQSGRAGDPPRLSEVPEASGAHPLSRRHDAVKDRASAQRPPSAPASAEGALPPLAASGDTVVISKDAKADGLIAPGPTSGPSIDDDTTDAQHPEEDSTLGDDPTTEPHPINLVRCAELEARLCARAQDRATILGDQQLSETDWRDLFEHWATRIQQECRQGSSQMRDRYDDVFTTGLLRLRGPVSELEAARIIVATERGELSLLTSELSLTVDELLKLSRALCHRTSSDDARRRATTRAVARLRSEPTRLALKTAEPKVAESTEPPIGSA